MANGILKGAGTTPITYNNEKLIQTSCVRHGLVHAAKSAGISYIDG